jgi:hypothetical protein
MFAPAIAQTVEWGNQQKSKGKLSYAQVLGENASGIFLARARTSDFRSEIVLEKYKSNLTIETAKDVYEPSFARTERIIITESGAQQFLSVKNQTIGKHELQLVSYDNALNQSIPIVLFNYDVSTLSSDRKITIRNSVDKRNFIIAYLTESNEKGKSILNLYVFNAQFQLKVSRRFPVKGFVNDLNLVNAECDAYGNFYGVVSMPRENVKGKDRGVKQFLFYNYQIATDNMLEYDIGKDSVYVNEVALVVNNFSLKVNIAGFYSEKNDEQCAGYFFYKVDIKTGEIEAVKYEKFDISFISKASTSMSGSLPSLSNLYVRKLVPNNEGGVTIVAEKYYETRQAYTFNSGGFPQTNYRTIYNYDEIIVVTTNNDGSARFKHFIKKNQTSVSDGGYYSSFLLLLTNGNIGIVYNQNVQEDDDVMMVTINNKGILDSKVLIKGMSYYVSIMPFESRQVSFNSAVITTLKDKRFCLMRLTF